MQENVLTNGEIMLISVRPTLTEDVQSALEASVASVDGLQTAETADSYAARLVDGKAFDQGLVRVTLTHWHFSVYYDFPSLFGAGSILLQVSL